MEFFTLFALSPLTMTMTSTIDFNCTAADASQSNYMIKDRERNQYPK